MRRDISEVKTGIIELKAQMADLFNHQSNRLPTWATLAFTVGGSLITGLTIWLITH